MGACRKKIAPRQYEQEKIMAKLVLVSAFLVSLIPATCARQAPEPTFQPVSAPIYVEPSSSKGKYYN
ncbi:MAG: hypothetical protein EA339_07540 [Rhodobacteraceae bacterium]|nr:MAG: hypothetical protein EA339_07540 [Paracoccaceae bacterium]